MPSRLLLHYLEYRFRVTDLREYPSFPVPSHSVTLSLDGRCGLNFQPDRKNIRWSNGPTLRKMKLFFRKTEFLSRCHVIRTKQGVPLCQIWLAGSK